jgi:hypothetical protein
MTNFYVDEGKLYTSEQVQRGLRDEVLEVAQAIYQENQGQKIALNVGFNKSHPIDTAKKRN